MKLSLFTYSVHVNTFLSGHSTLLPSSLCLLTRKERQQHTCMRDIYKGNATHITSNYQLINVSCLKPSIKMNLGDPNIKLNIIELRCGGSNNLVEP